MIELTQAAATTVRDPLVVTLFVFVSTDCRHSHYERRGTASFTRL